MLKYEIEVCLGKLCVSSFTSILLAKIMKERGEVTLAHISTPFGHFFSWQQANSLSRLSFIWYHKTKATFGVQPDQSLGLFMQFNLLPSRRRHHDLNNKLYRSPRFELLTLTLRITNQKPGVHILVATCTGRVRR